MVAFPVIGSISRLQLSKPTRTPEGPGFHFRKARQCLPRHAAGSADVERHKGRMKPFLNRSLQDTLPEPTIRCCPRRNPTRRRPSRQRHDVHHGNPHPIPGYLHAESILRKIVFRPIPTLRRPPKRLPRRCQKRQRPDSPKPTSHLTAHSTDRSTRVRPIISPELPRFTTPANQPPRLNHHSHPFGLILPSQTDLWT